MILVWVSALAFASPTATTVAKNGSCPSDYSSSGNYCKPEFRCEVCDRRTVPVRRTTVVQETIVWRITMLPW